MTRRRDLRRYAATQQRLRWEWRQQAYGILSTYAKLRPVWGMGGDPNHYVVVDDRDWLELPNPTGCQVVQLRVGTARLNMAAFRAHWDQMMGYPDCPPWRWEFDPTPPGWLIGHPYALPTSLHLPEVDYDNPELWDRVVIGEAEDGTILDHDLVLSPHGLWGGQTRRGKSSGILLYATHLLAVGRLQALIVCDPKGGGEYTSLRVPAGHPAAWNPDDCTGICVATPTFDADGQLLDYRMLEQAAAAVRRETGRRRLHDAAFAPPDPYWRHARVLWVLDEAADLFDSEPKPDSKDDSDPAERIRTRNRQRDAIAQTMRHETMLGAKFATSVVPAAQSPRREFVAGAVHANLAFKAYLGRGDSIELGIVFGHGRTLPTTPLDLPGRGVWLNNRIGAPPTDPYLAFQAYLPDLDRLARLVEGFTPATLPTITGSPNGHKAHLPSM